MNDTPLNGIYEIDDRWNEQMLSLVRESPIEANGLKLVFDRSPDIFFIPRLRSVKIRCAGYFLQNQLCGFALMLQKEVFVGGMPQSVLYFGNLVVAHWARGKMFLYRLSDFFLKDLSVPDSFGHAVILKGNAAAKKLLNRFHPRFPNIPYSRAIGEWHVKNILLPIYIKSRSRYAVRHAEMTDIDTIAALLNQEYQNRLFGPVITRAYIEHLLVQLPGFEIGNYYIAENKKEIAGVCCAWDMAPVKRNCLVEYNRTLKFVRCLVNAVGRILRFPGLPPEGEPFRDVTVTDYSVIGRDPEILKALLLKVYREYRHKKYHLMLFGHAADDPLKAAARCFATQSIVSEIHIFSKSKEVIDEFESTSYPWIDMTLL